LKDQFEDLSEDVIEIAASIPSRVGEFDPGVLASFQEALHLPTKIKDNDHDDDELPYPLEVARLTDMETEAAFGEINAAEQLFVPALIHLAYNSESETEIANAISLLQTIQDKCLKDFDFLSPWLDQAEGNWRDELLSSKIRKIGGCTSQVLLAYASDTNKVDNIRGATTEALVERAQCLPEQRDEVIAFSRELLTRPEAYEASEENFVARLDGDCVDLNARGSILPNMCWSKKFSW